MKKTFFAFIVMIFYVITVYSQADYKMWETMYITPKPGQAEALEKGLAEHHKKFHPEGPYQVHVWEVLTGKHEGQWLWAMGPCTFTSLDSRPETDEHDVDWAKLVAPFIESMHESKYWKLNEKVSWDPENAPSGKVLWTTYDIRPFESYRFIEMLKKVVEVYKQKKYPYGFYVYENQFDSGDGEDFVIEWAFDKWAYFDDEMKFSKDYEEVHGEGTWRQFMEEYKDVVEKAIDELAEFNADASSPTK